MMMRGSEHWVVSVRRPDGTIASMEKALPGWQKRFPFLKLILVRGVVAMVEAMTLAIGAIGYSAQESTDSDVEISSRELAISVLFGLALALGLFFAFPVWLTKSISGHAPALTGKAFSGTVLYNLVEGMIRLLIFFSYLYVVSKLKDIRRVFEYHGAEHRAIHAFEHGEELTVDNLSKYGTEHLRCGTSFLLVVMVVSMIVFTLLGRPPSILARIASRLVILPLVAGISYEVIKYSARHEDSLVTKVIAWPGLLLQRLTTRTPAPDQMEVAIHSLKRILELEAAD